MPLDAIELVRMTIEVSVYVGVLLFGFLFSWKYLRVRCFIPLHIHSFSQKLVFSFTFIVSCFGLTALLLADITRVMSVASRMLLWRITLSVVVQLLIVIYPAIQIYHFFTKNYVTTAVWSKRKQLPLVFCAWAALVLFHWWGLSPKKVPFQNEIGVSIDGVSVDSSNRNNDSIWSYPGWVRRIGIVGTVLTAMLSGYGSVAYLHEILFPEARNGKEELLARFREQLSDNERFISEKYDKLRRLKSAGNSNSDSFGYNGGGGGGNNDGNVFGLIGKLKSTSEYEDTLHDIEALESFGRRLRDEISRIQRAQEEEKVGRAHMSMRDKVDRWVSWGVALYCAYYILAGLYTFFVLGCSSGDGPDVITMSISLFLSLFNVSIDTHFWSQLCSAIFSGGMVFTSLRNFFLNSSKIAKKYDIHDDDDYYYGGRYGGGNGSGARAYESSFLLPTKSNGKSSISKKNWSRIRVHIVVGMCQIMGAYFLSVLILTAGSLPHSSRETFAASLGGLDAKFYREWSNAVLGISILGSIITILIKRKRSYNK